MLGLLRPVTSCKSLTHSGGRILSQLSSSRGYLDNFGVRKYYDGPNENEFIPFAPKSEIDIEVTKTAFTLIKQKKINVLLEKSPQVIANVRPIKWLTVENRNEGGRNVSGVYSQRFRGGRHVRHYRLVDFKRSRRDIWATVQRIEYDPDRTARIALVQYEDGVLSYVLAPSSIRPGDKIIASRQAPIAPGNCLPLSEIPDGSIVHNIELHPGRGGQFIRAAGCYATIVSRDDQFVTIKMKSTEIRRIPLECWATVGQLSNLDQGSRILGKAGVAARMGHRPRVRGNAMNPQAHPHGGGNYKKHTKFAPLSFWGKPAQDYKTRWRHKPSARLVLVRKNDVQRVKGHRKLNYLR